MPEKLWEITFIGPDGEETRIVVGPRNQEQAKRALREQVPTAHIVHVGRVVAE